MMRSRNAAQVQADLGALYAAADRAGRALGCVFSSYDEFEAALRPRHCAHVQSRAAPVLATIVLTIAFLLM